jgi:putative hydrolase of the HAD superfamily
MNSIRAVCFDLDNTLWDVWPVIQRAEHAMYDFLAQRYPKVVAELTLDAMRAARERVAIEHPQMQHDFTFLRRQALREHARMVGYADSMADEAFEVFMCARNEITLFDEVLPALECLRRKYRLFTASNGNADLRRVGIAHLFERSIAAREVGVLKPHAAVFHKVVEGTGLSLSETVYVGDDPWHDVEGARAAGMAAVWINRTQIQWPDELPPPAVAVRCLTELAGLLGCELGTNSPLERRF